MNAKQLRQFIIKNNNDCALLIGNGINRYKNAGCSWEILLKDLAEKYCPNLAVKELPKGISNTEYFDILEITNIKETPNFDPDKLKIQNVNIDMPKVSLNEESSRTVQQMSYNSSFSLNDLRSYKGKLKELKLSLESVDFDLVRTIISLGENKLTALVRSKYITSICSDMKKWIVQPIHKSVALFADKYNVPILTTNYDTLLDNAIDARETIFEHEAFSSFFPVSLCYTHREKPNPDDFAIWHVNGVIHYPSSILIGLSHYIRSIECIRKLLLTPNYFNAEIIRAPYYKSLGNTWIKHILSRHLIIIGLSLKRDETLIRWLLLERSKLFAMYPHITKKGFFVISDSDEEDVGKELFLNSVGIDIVRVKDYDSMYKIISA